MSALPSYLQWHPDPMHPRVWYVIRPPSHWLASAGVDYTTVDRVQAVMRGIDFRLGDLVTRELREC